MDIKGSAAAVNKLHECNSFGGGQRVGTARCPETNRDRYR